MPAGHVDAARVPEPVSRGDQQRRPLLPAPAGRKPPQLAVVAAIAGVLVVPIHHGLLDFRHRGDFAVGIEKVVHQRRVDHVPGAVVKHFRHAVASDSPTAGFEPEIAGQRLHVAGGAAAHAVAVDVNGLEDVVHVVLNVLVGRIGLMAVFYRRPPDRQHLLLIAHAIGDVGLLPGFRARYVLDFVGQYLHVADNADWRRIPGIGRPRHVQSAQCRQGNRPYGCPSCKLLQHEASPRIAGAHGLPEIRYGTRSHCRIPPKATQVGRKVAQSRRQTVLR